MSTASQYEDAAEPLMTSPRPSDADSGGDAEQDTASFYSSQGNGDVPLDGVDHGASFPDPESASALEEANIGQRDVDEYDAFRDRALRDSVVFSHCSIRAERLVARDSIEGPGGALFVARVQPDHLGKLTDVYEAPGCAARAARLLESERLVCLRGAEGSGRTALAIELLRNRAGTEVWQIRPHTPVAELSAAGFSAKRGYFLSLGPTDFVSDFELTRLRAICEDISCHLVLICAARGIGSPDDGRIVDVSPPSMDWIDLLGRHVTRELAPAARYEVDALLASPEVRDWCHNSHRLAELDVAAGVIAGVVQGRIERTALAEHLSLAGQGIQVWFDHPDREALRPLCVTLAFFGGMPVNTVLELEERLSLRLRETAGQTQPRDLFAVPGRARLAEVSAHVSTAEIKDTCGPLCTEVAEFADRTWDSKLARLLRSEYPLVRPVLIDWLRDLAGHPDTQIQLCAAAALGGFAEDNISVLIRDVIEPWARLPGQRAWRKVVWALTVPLGNADAVPRVTRVLERWAASASPGLVRSAAMVYGMVLAPADPAGALSGLARIARFRGPGGRRWTTQTASGVRAMYLKGFTEDVLRALGRWTRSASEAERELAFTTFKLIARIEETVVLAERPGGQAGAASEGRRQTWPSILLAAGKKRTSADVIKVSREALNCPRWSPVALAALQHWFTRANGNSHLVKPLLNFVTALAATSAEADRLAHHLQMWARMAPEGAAARVCALLEPRRVRHPAPPSLTRRALRAPSLASPRFQPLPKRGALNPIDPVRGPIRIPRIGRLPQALMPRMHEVVVMRTRAGVLVELPRGNPPTFGQRFVGGFSEIYYVDSGLQTRTFTARLPSADLGVELLGDIDVEIKVEDCLQVVTERRGDLAEQLANWCYERASHVTVAYSVGMLPEGGLPSISGQVTSALQSSIRCVKLPGLSIRELRARLRLANGEIIDKIGKETLEKKFRATSLIDIQAMYQSILGPEEATIYAALLDGHEDRIPDFLERLEGKRDRYDQSVQNLLHSSLDHLAPHLRDRLATELIQRKLGIDLTPSPISASLYSRACDDLDDETSRYGPGDE